MAVEIQDKARRLVEASRELEKPDQESFLRQACRESKELWIEVQHLLEHGEGSSVEIEESSGPQVMPLVPIDPIATAGRAGRFEVVERVGSGGFGVVYKGHDPMLKRTVAIKTCTSADEGFRKRFFREAEIAARLQHPNITTVHELGIQDGVPFLVQEFLSGEDLEEMIARRDEIDIDVKLNCLEQVARGLQYAHSRGVLHRDIKPANVRLLDDGSCKIMDFGIARLLNEETRLTSTGMTVGTVGYLAPEQLKADPVDHRADIFAFGVMAYEFLAYERPFKGSNFSQVCYQLLQVDPPPLVLSFPGCDPRMAALVEKCLSKEPVDRPDDFSCIEEEIRQIRRDWSPGPAGAFDSAEIDPEGATRLLETGAEPVLTVPTASATVSVRGGLVNSPAPPTQKVSAGAAPATGASSPFSQPVPTENRAGGSSAMLVGSVLAFIVMIAVGGLVWWKTAGSGSVPDEVPGERTSQVANQTVADSSMREPVAERDLPAQNTEEPTSAAADQRDVERDAAVVETAQDRTGIEENAPAERAEPKGTRSKAPEAAASKAGGSATRSEPAQRRETRRAETVTDPVQSRDEPATRLQQANGEERSQGSQTSRMNEASTKVRNEGASDIGATGGDTRVAAQTAVEESAPEPASAVERRAVAAEPTGPIQPGTEDRKPVPLERQRPDYPERARRRKVEAKVVVAVLVNAEGKVDRAILKQRDDSPFGFNEAAIAAAKKTRFQPATRNGVPGSMWTELPFEFRLR